MFRFTVKFLFFCILIISSESVFAESGETNYEISQQVNNHEELTQRLEELIEQLRLERSDYYLQKAQYDTQIQKAQQNHDILKKEIEELRQKESDSDKQILKYKEEVEDIKSNLASREVLEKVLREQAEPFIASQKTIIEKGIPYKQEERIERLESKATGISGNESNSISAANQLENIWNYSLEELRIGRSSETYTARAKISDNATPYARYFRVGQLILGFIIEDGRQAAMWLPNLNKDGFFITNDKKQSEQIRSAVEILDHHQPSEFVELPVSLTLTQAKEESNAEN